MPSETRTTRHVTDDSGKRLAERAWLRAQQYIADGQTGAARAALEAVLQREPDKFAARMLLASVHLSEGRVREAATEARLASQSPPDDPNAVAAAAQCLIRIGEMTAANACLARYDVLSRKLDGRQLRAIARIYQLLGDNAMALELMNRAQAQDYDNADFRYFHGLQLQFSGQAEAARQEMRECLRRKPTYGRAALALARLSKRDPDATRLAFIHKQAIEVKQGTEEHAALEFARFEELDTLGRRDDAFVALRRANAIMHMRLAGEFRISSNLMDSLKRIVSSEFIKGSGASIDGPVPIFIIGMPRSGTTLLDRMLDNHPDVVSTGERNDFPLQLRWSANVHGNQILDTAFMDQLGSIDYEELGRRYLEQTQWRAAGKAFYVDKLPPNWMLAGLIRRALPRAPILHMARAPMDVCFSNYKVLFGNSYPFSYDLAELAHYHHLYRDLMGYWHGLFPGRLLDVPYRQLVTDPERVLQRIFAYCGLRAVEGCSEITRNTSPVATLSSPQVREPVHARGLDQWRPYARHLAPLVAALHASATDEPRSQAVPPEIQTA